MTIPEPYDTKPDTVERCEHHAKVASRILRDTSLPFEVRALVALLVDVAGKDGTFRRGRRSLADLTGWSVEKLDRVMRQAKKAGFVEAVRTGRSNEWRITDACRLRTEAVPVRRLRAVPDEADSSPATNQSRHQRRIRVVTGDESTEEQVFEELLVEEQAVGEGERGRPAPLARPAEVPTARLVNRFLRCLRDELGVIELERGEWEGLLDRFEAEWEEPRLAGLRREILDGVRTRLRGGWSAEELAREVFDWRPPVEAPVECLLAVIRLRVWQVGAERRWSHDGDGLAHL